MHRSEPKDAFGFSALATAAMFALALAWLWLLRGYGFQLEDEGTLLFQFERVLNGQRPYLDFHTGYTPGYFAFGSQAMSWFGVSATAVRTVLAVTNALSAAALYVATRRVAGAWIAPLPALIWLAFTPAYVGEFAAFNIPYPTWPATAAWMLVVLAMLRWSRTGSLLSVAAAGASAALALLLRPDAGAFALAGSAWALCATSSSKRSIDRLATLAASLFMALGVWFTFQFQVFTTDAVVHLLPTLAVAVLACSLRGRGQPSGRPPAVTALSVLAASFLLPTLAWMAPLYQSLGHDKFLFEVLLVGADYQSLYFTPHPAPQLHAAFAALAALTIAAAGWATKQSLLPEMGTGTILLVGLVGGFLGAITTGLAPEGIAQSISSQLENAAYWLALLANGGCIAFIARKATIPIAGNDKGETQAAVFAASTRDLLVLTPLAIAMYLQLYPRSDFMHQITAVPLTAVVAAALLNRVTGWWSELRESNRPCPQAWVRSAVWSIATLVLVIETGPMANAAIRTLGAPHPSAPMPARLNVHVEAGVEDELIELQTLVTWLQDNVAAKEPVLSFPATSGLLFAAGLTNPSPHDYWFPGRPDTAEERRVLANIRRDPPRFVLTINRHWTFFSGAPEAFPALRKFVVENYTLAARSGRYDLLHHREQKWGQAPFQEPLLLLGASKLTQAAAYEAAIEPDLSRRRQAARRWMEAIKPEHAQAATLPASPRDRVLLLRAIRDGGDLRAAAWVMAGFSDPNPRVRSEAIGAMQQLAKEYTAARHRLADDFDPAALQPFLQGLDTKAAELRDFDRTKAFAAILLEAKGLED